MSDTELHPLAERAIAELQKPLIPLWSGETRQSMIFRQRDRDNDVLHSLLLDGIERAAGSLFSSDARAKAADALEAHDQVWAFIEARDEAEETAKAAAEAGLQPPITDQAKLDHARRMPAHLEGT